MAASWRRASSFIRHGENGKGIGSRWYPETLATRLTEPGPGGREDRFPARQMGCRSWRNFHRSSDALYFIDPPYTAGGKRAGRRLYTHHLLDHDRLFTVCESLQGNFLITYDEADAVKAMARRHNFQMRLIPMKNTHHATMKELVIGRNLAWLDELPAVRESIADYRVEAQAT
jgi:DNA adenine methylase